MLRMIFEFLAGDDLNTNNPKNVDSLKSIVEQDYSELCRKQIKVADATVDQSITLADASSEYLAIMCDQEITIKLNGSSDAMTLTPRLAGTKSIVFVMKGTITALTVSNASGSECNMDVISINI